MWAIMAKEPLHDSAGILNAVLHMTAKGLDVDAATSLSFLTDLLVLGASSRESLARLHKPQ
jgi:hypothetical protein